MMPNITFQQPELLQAAATLLEPSLPKPGHRLMNLPTPCGIVDLAHVQINFRPEGLRPAQLGHLLSATGRANILAALIDQGPLTTGELEEHFRGQGKRLDRYNLELLASEGLVKFNPDAGKLSVHPQITPGMASITVWQLQPAWAYTGVMADFAVQVNHIHMDADAPVIHQGAQGKPLDTAVFLSVLGSALEGITCSEHPDVGHAQDLQGGWTNCANVR